MDGPSAGFWPWQGCWPYLQRVGAKRPPEAPALAMPPRGSIKYRKPWNSPSQPWSIASPTLPTTGISPPSIPMAATHVVSPAVRRRLKARVMSWHRLPITRPSTHGRPGPLTAPGSLRQGSVPGEIQPNFPWRLSMPLLGSPSRFMRMNRAPSWLPRGRPITFTGPPTAAT